MRRWPRGARGGVGGGESIAVSFGGRRRNDDGGGVAGLPEGRGSVGRKEGVEAVGWATQVGCTGGAGPAQVSDGSSFSLFFYLLFSIFVLFSFI